MDLRLRYTPPPAGMLNHSQLVDFLRCRYRWNLSAVRNIQRRTFHMPLDRGSAVHYGIAATLRVFSEGSPSTPLTKLVRAGRSAVHKWLEAATEDRGGKHNLSQEQSITVEELEDTAPVIVERWIRQFDLPRFEVLRLGGKPVIERSLICPLPLWDGFHCTLDVVLVERIKTRPVWLLDWKVRESFHSDDDEEFNLQKAAYQHVLNHHGIRTEGSIMYQIRAAIPAIPKTNKDGSINRSKIATDWETYRRTVVKAGLNPDDYEEDMKPKCDEIQWFRETRVYRPPTKVERIWRRIVVRAAKMMARERGDIFRTMGKMTCSGCWAQEFCLAELHGEDLSILLRTSFVDSEDPQPLLALSTEDSEFFVVTLN